MPTVRVKMFATVREAAGVAEVELEAVDVWDLLRRLGEMFGPSLSELLEGAKNGSAVILVNGRNVKFGPGDPVPLQEADDVSIFPPVSGG